MAAADMVAGAPTAPARTHGAHRPRRRTRSVVQRLIIAALLIAGAAVSLRPVVTAVLGARATIGAATTYSTEVRELSQHEVANALAAAEAYNASLTSTTITDPWGSQDPAASADHTAYAKLLNLTGDGTIGRVRIPQIDVDLPITHDATWDSMSHAAGHMYGSSLPVGGEGTHAVIAAHTGNELTFFDRLPEVRDGQTFILEVAGRTMTYEIDQINVVEATDLSQVRLVKGRDLVTLVTCYTPPGGHKMRLLVRGHRVANAEVATAAASTSWTSQVPGYQAWMLPRAAVALVALLALAAFVIVWHRQDRSERCRRPGQADVALPLSSPSASSRGSGSGPGSAPSGDPSVPRSIG